MSKPYIALHQDICDWTYFLPLVERTAEHFRVSEVAEDKAYLYHKKLQSVEAVKPKGYVEKVERLIEEGRAEAR
jgi:hypothetical protein